MLTAGEQLLNLIEIKIKSRKQTANNQTNKQFLFL
jgi:hypothetical protein